MNAKVVIIAVSRALIAAFGVAMAMLVIACAAIDPPAPFTKAEAGSSATQVDAGAYERCRVLDRRFSTNVKAKVYGDAPGPQAVCVTLEVPVPAAGPGAIVFCVAGVLGNVVVPSVHNLTADLQSCAYCTYLQTNCALTTGGTADAGVISTCETSYAVLSGRARIVRFGKTPGESVWIDIGDLEVARVIRRDGAQVDVERIDCLFADGLTLQGVLERGSATACTGIEETACTIANTAASRVGDP